jgi:hypothetical protein
MPNKLIEIGFCVNEQSRCKINNKYTSVKYDVYKYKHIVLGCLGIALRYLQQ